MCFIIRCDLEEAKKTCKEVVVPWANKNMVTSFSIMKWFVAVKVISTEFPINHVFIVDCQVLKLYDLVNTYK